MDDTATSRFDLTEEQLLLQETVRRFADTTLAPRARAMDHAAALDPVVVSGLRELGLTGLVLPEDVGGAAMDTVAFAIALEEIARGDGASAWTLLSHLGCCAATIATAGSSALRESLLPALASGETLGGVAYAEKDAGSDFFATRCVAAESGSSISISGVKLPVTNAASGGVFLVTAREGAAVDAPLSLFAVAANSANVKRGRRIETLGLRAADIGEVSFENCVVEASHRIGARGDALSEIEKSRVLSRIGVAAIGLGLARAAQERAARYSRERVTFGKPIGEHQAVALKLADMSIAISAARQLVLLAARTHAAGGDAARCAIEAKIFASEAAVKVAYDAIQVHGGYGYSAEYEVERMWRDAKYMTLGEGTNDMLRIGLEVRE